MKILTLLFLIFPTLIFSQSVTQKTTSTRSLESAADSISKQTDSLVHETHSLKNQSQPKRYLVKYPNTNDFESKENCTIVLQVVIDENGNVIDEPLIVQSQTTTTDMELIKTVLESAKTEFQYNSCPGAKKQTKTITIRLVAH